MSRPFGSTWASRLVCSRTGETAPLDGPASLSPAGAPWLVEYDLEGADGRALAAAWRERPWSLWRYRELLPVVEPEPRANLGEGGTPLLRLRGEAGRRREIWVKEESRNPTGSFKARGLAVAVQRACELGAPGVQLPSAGNAALALAAYAAAVDLPCRVAMPVDTPETLVERCRAHGAEVLLAGQTIVEAAARLRELPGDHWDLSTLREPYRVEGKKTMALELAEQMEGEVATWIFYPTGGGTGIVGMARGFEQLARLGLASGVPRFVVVQTTGCAPLVRAFEEGAERATPWEDPKTDVWGLRVPQAIGDFLILAAVRRSGGTAVAVAPEEIAAARAVAARAGMRFGPEGAAALAALHRLAGQGVVRPGQSAVVFQTGDPANYGL